MKKLLILLLIIGFYSCDNSCKKKITCKFNKGDEVQIKSSRWARKGVVIEKEVTDECECVYGVSQTTWIEGRRVRTLYEYELEVPGNGIDSSAERIIRIIE